MNDSTQTVRTPEEKISPLNKLIGIFTNPVSVFKNLVKYPDWLLPFVLMAIMIIISVTTTVDLQYKAGEKAIMENSLIPEEVKDQAVEELHNKTPMAMTLQSGIRGIIGLIVLYLFVALVFWISGNFIFGGQASYKQVFSMYSWGAIPGIIETIVKLPLMITKGTMEVYTSPAILMDSGQSKDILFQLMNAFDVFTIWKIILWSIGFGAIYNFSKGKSYITVITLYVIYLIISISLSQLF